MLPYRYTQLLTLVVCLWHSQSTAQAQKNGDPAETKTATLRMRIAYKGEPPLPLSLEVKSDPFCKQHSIPDERLLVSSDGSLENVLLIWDEAKNKAIMPKSFPALTSAQVDFKLEGCRFRPHIVVARVGQKLVVNSPDRTGHNPNIEFLNHPPSGALRPAGAPWTERLTVSEPGAMTVTCGVHSWERAYLVVKDHPFVGLSNDRGLIEIKDLPLGKNWFRIWHELIGKDFQLVWNGTATEAARGRISFDLVAGVNDLGTIELDAKQFRSRDDGGSK